VSSHANPGVKVKETVLEKAVFDPKVKIYWYFHGLIVHFSLILAGVGLVTFPIWLVLGMFFVTKRFDALHAQLTDRSIHLKAGYIFRVEKTIPLEKIQDLSLRSGPLLNAFGLASVQVETAGSSAQQGADMVLPGLSNAEAFRNAVLEQRDIRSGAVPAAAPAAVPATLAAAADSSHELLTEIRDSLHRIEKLLAR
jgi:membrane protein YdbS with pleckstrin-like domain